MGGFFAKDLELLSEEQVMNSPGGAARRPIDYVHEVTVVNRGIACQLRGEDPNPLFSEQQQDENKFVIAPSSLTHQEALEAFKASLAEVREIVNGMSKKICLRLDSPSSVKNQPTGSPSLLRSIPITIMDS